MQSGPSTSGNLGAQVEPVEDADQGPLSSKRKCDSMIAPMPSRCHPQHVGVGGGGDVGLQRADEVADHRVVLLELAQRLGEVGVLGRHRREQERVLAAVVTVERGAEAVAEEQQVRLADGVRPAATSSSASGGRHATGRGPRHLPTPGHQPGVLLLAHVAPTLARTSSGPDPREGVRAAGRAGISPGRTGRRP